MCGGVLSPLNSDDATETLDAMTEEQAVEYLIMKDIPPRIWRGHRGNRTILRIVTVDQLPTDRRYRNAWAVASAARARLPP